MIGSKIGHYQIKEKISPKDGGQVGEGGNLSRRKLKRRTG